MQVVGVAYANNMDTPGDTSFVMAFKNFENLHSLNNVVCTNQGECVRSSMAIVAFLSAFSHTSITASLVCCIYAYLYAPVFESVSIR